MAYEESLRSITLTADSSLGIHTGVPGQPGAPSGSHGAKQYTFVKVTGAHQCGSAGASDLVVGVLQNKPQGAGHAATVGIRGVSKVIAADAITAGDTVVVDADGKATSGTGAGVVGVALSTTANEDEIVSVLLTL